MRRILIHSRVAVFGRSFSTEVENTITSRRNWFPVSPDSVPSKDTITVSSYNLLSQHYMWENVYDHIAPKYTSWEFRLPLINQNMLDLCSLVDLMCFQEMEFKVYTECWKELLGKQGYESLFQRKRASSYWKKSPEEMDGVSVFYNTEKFELLDCKPVDLAAHFSSPDLFIQTKDLHERAVKQNTVALIVTLRHKSTGAVIFLANTHLYWSPQYSDVKLLQTYLLVGLIKQTMKQHFSVNNADLEELMREGRTNVFLVGDFNSAPDSMVYEYLDKGYLAIGEDYRIPFDYGQANDTVIKTGLLQFCSSYKSFVNSPGFIESKHSQAFERLIDYIWINKYSKNLKLSKVLGDLNPKIPSDLLQFPNRCYPSDHLPLLAQFEIQ
ncbi:hypothetical protein OGAPHI_003522 [Ogataea philodendri]|uniref:Endonuclease/exonuclease/phosphatase domain-containing protein n=1 Tax=Ogataea philodendri TaxID=1378263 RepID=A0A9P8P794_9ASCO|nr:uncharacterized protein OGAPHI_003522 [Ogataea philodendri]KAH3666525.1 hypothetical protein OGAPHI_003522 [Ogataea philodendri]